MCVYIYTHQTGVAPLIFEGTPNKSNRDGVPNSRHTRM